MKQTLEPWSTNHSRSFHAAQSDGNKRDGEARNLNDAANPTSDHRVQTSLRDDKFYFSLVTFKVGCRLFRVPREGFELHSEVFRNVFAFEGPQKGNTDDDPIIISHVKESAFEDFLQLLYPRYPTKYGSLPTSYQNDPSRLLSVLYLAHKWRFEDIKQYVISKIEKLKLDEITNATLARRYRIKSWYLPVCITLAKRKNSFTLKEAEKLGWEFTMKMVQIRERRLSRMIGHSGKQDQYLERDLKEAFGA